MQLPMDQSNSISIGSLVETSKGCYYFSIPYGRIESSGFEVMCLSMGSPLGEALKGKKVGDTIHWMNDTITILNIS
jgi:hypothetical protein